MPSRFSIRSTAWPVVLAGALAATPCPAQPVADPTRPAAAWLAAQARAAGAPAAAEPATPGVRILVLGPTRKFVVVDGSAVRLGESYNGSTLASLGEGGVVWRRGGSREKSNMSPNVQKIVRATPAAPETGSMSTKTSERRKQ